MRGVVTLDGSAFDILDRIKNRLEQVVQYCRRAFGEREEILADGSLIQDIDSPVPLLLFLPVYLKQDSLNHDKSQMFAKRVKGTGEMQNW